jgi:hypothetical protein
LAEELQQLNQIYLPSKPTLIGASEMRAKHWIVVVLLVCVLSVSAVHVWKGGDWTNKENARLVVENVNIQSWSQTKIENHITTFLKTTDVSEFLLENSVEIVENYKGGWYVEGLTFIVDYTTSHTGHPDFTLKAFENHRARITLSTNGEVVEALCCIEPGELIFFWDLINQRWDVG